MPDIVLNDSDRNFLRQCPLVIYHRPRATQKRADLERFKRIKRLQADGLVSGSLRNGSTGELQILAVAITNRGRVALGLPPVPDALP